jgi:hypothetical protein
MGGACGMYGRREMHAGFWWGNVNDRDCVVDHGRIILECISETQDVRVWTGLIWLRARRNGKLLLT